MILDSGIIKDYFQTAGDFVRFSEEENQDVCLEIHPKTRWSEELLTDMLKHNRQYRNLGELSDNKGNLADLTDSAGKRWQYRPVEPGAGTG
ncbi:hypothetical protein [Acetobacterium sp.]|uniref:hypothetical protein n=1 Tax=Acetobacterium sp. TaxID=1872094 RepID=UPI003592E88B